MVQMWNIDMKSEVRNISPRYFESYSSKKTKYGTVKIWRFGQWCSFISGWFAVSFLPLPSFPTHRSCCAGLNSSALSAGVWYGWLGWWWNHQCWRCAMSSWIISSVCCWAKKMMWMKLPFKWSFKPTTLMGNAATKLNSNTTASGMMFTISTGAIFCPSTIFHPHIHIYIYIYMFTYIYIYTVYIYASENEWKWSIYVRKSSRFPHVLIAQH